MIKDLTDLLAKKYEELTVDTTVDLESMQRSGDDIKFTEPVSINGRLYRLEDDVVFFSGYLKTSLETACGRCLEPVSENIDIDFDEVVYAEGREEDYDLIIEPEGETIDLEAFVINLLELKLPLKFLCDEECKGLCPVCGTNLNTSQCNCNDEKIDERFAMLKDLFKDR
ncbi:MAG: DUF177 domain-containing protein [Clostridiales bacterium]|nr:DUF177 domain-containing protein [Clostridiales bacterium]